MIRPKGESPSTAFSLRLHSRPDYCLRHQAVRPSGLRNSRRQLHARTLSRLPPAQSQCTLVLIAANRRASIACVSSTLPPPTRTLGICRCRSLQPSSCRFQLTHLLYPSFLHLSIPHHQQSSSSPNNILHRLAEALELPEIHCFFPSLSACAFYSYALRLAQPT